ncbi:MAG: ABC transporter substrate-binding protein, partial [Spirochaetaceae bacterium]
AAGSANLGTANLSREFIDAYRLRPPWEPEMPSFLPVDPEEHERWMRLMELRSRFLFRREPSTGGWRPDAAASADLDVTEGKLTVRLREGLVWSDGTPVAAADWVVAVEEIYQRPGIQSPLKAYTESGGAVWRALDKATIEVSFETVPVDPLSILAVPPLPLEEPRVASLAQGNLHVLFDLEAAKDELPILLRPGETPGLPDSIPALAGSDEPGGLPASTGAGDRGLVLLAASDLDVSGVLEGFREIARGSDADPGLLLLPWEGALPRHSGADPGAPVRRFPPETRIAYSFASPGARGAAELIAALLEERGVEETTVVPENARVLDSALPLLLSGERPLPGDVVVVEVVVDPRYSVPLSLAARIGGMQSRSCARNGVDGVGEWYRCIEGLLIEQLGALSDGPVRLLILGLLPRLALVSPGACFTEPVPYRARAIDLGEVSEASEEDQS